MRPLRTVKGSSYVIRNKTKAPKLPPGQSWHILKLTGKIPIAGSPCNLVRAIQIDYQKAHFTFLWVRAFHGCLSLVRISLEQPQTVNAAYMVIRLRCGRRRLDQHGMMVVSGDLPLWLIGLPNRLLRREWGP